MTFFGHKHGNEKCKMGFSAGWTSIPCTCDPWWTPFFVFAAAIAVIATFLYGVAWFGWLVFKTGAIIAPVMERLLPWRVWP